MKVKIAESHLKKIIEEEKESFMKEIGLEKTGLNKLIKEGYDLLNLNTFFTSGPEESRAWTIKNPFLHLLWRPPAPA